MSRRVPDHKTRVCLFVGVFLFALSAGCSRKPAAPVAGAEPRTLRVSASELFVGDLKRVEPHLALTSNGCIRLEYGAPDRFITLEPQVWQNGKLIPCGRSSTRARKGPADASISISPMSGPGGKRQIRIITAVTGAEDSFTHTWIQDEPVSGSKGTHATVKKLSEPVELMDGQSVAVWAYLVYKMGEQVPPKGLTDSFEDAAKGAQWAVVLKIGWEEPNGR